MRSLVLIDVSNLYYCVHKRLGGRLDYTRLLQFIESKGQIVRAIAYGSQMNGQADSFITFLNNLGVETRYKEPRIYNNPDGVNRKADWDVGIAMDAVRTLDLYDTLVLISADGDLGELVKWVHEKGRRSIVIGAGINRTLRELAGESIELTIDFLEKDRKITVC